MLQAYLAFSPAPALVPRDSLELPQGAHVPFTEEWYIETKPWHQVCSLHWVSLLLGHLGELS